jgi:hypothetical protein
VALAAGALALAAPSAASAAGPPLLGATYSEAVLSSSARLHAELDPNGAPAKYHFDYITQAAYEANLAASQPAFAGGSRAPSPNDASLPAPLTVTQLLFSLKPETSYRYRVVASNSAGTTTGTPHAFTTFGLGGGAVLPDSRGWERVSPVDKNGGEVALPGTIAGGGVLQAATGGGAVTYGSEASFGPGAPGAPPASQYLATRTTGGWATENLTAPIFSASFHLSDEGVPYQLFSTDLARGLLLNGEHCRGEGSGCAVANPPLAGTDAPAGYQNYYLREGGGYASLLTAADLADTDLDPADFDLRLAGTSPDLRHVVLSSCAALTADATEVPLGEGCDPDRQNLYEWSGGGLGLLNILPAQSTGTPGAELAAQAGAVAGDGSRIYWADSSTGALYLREGVQTKLVDAGPVVFQTATPDGAFAFYLEAAHLHRYDSATQVSTDLTPGGGVVGVLGASGDGSRVYYQDAGGLRLWSGGATTTVAPGADAADPGDYPPATGAARVSADGARLLFVSKAPLTGYDNIDLNTGEPDSEVFLYDAGAADLACLSCNPTNQRPLGPSTIPGARANGTAEASTHSYKPRVLAADGRRAFFESGDALVLTDANSGATDVYQWEAQGVGSCAKTGGCVALISSGRSAGGAGFVDASADGADAFFITGASLVSSDPGALDLYDARVGGGFEEPPASIACAGDACQPLPPEPVDPTLTTLLEGPGNPPVRYIHKKRRVPKHHRRHRKHRHEHQKQGSRR